MGLAARRFAHHHFALAALAVLAWAAPAAGQSARGVRLAIHPRAGDTIHTRLEQEVEMVTRRAAPAGQPRDEAADSRSAMRTTALLRNIVVGSDDEATTMAIVLDSIALEANGMPKPGDSARRAMMGRRVRVRVALDGAMTVLDPEGIVIGGSAIGSMPATLPDGPVAVGERWRRTLEIPLAGEGGGGGVRVDATFRLDSLGRRGELAYVSMRGSILRDTARLRGARVQRVTSGTVTGAMAVDRRRGWVADSRTTLDLRSLVTRADAPGLPPLTIDVRVSQWMRVVDRD